MMWSMLINNVEYPSNSSIHKYLHSDYHFHSPTQNVDTNQKMALLTEIKSKYLILLVLFFTIESSEGRSLHVMIPKSDPFFMHHNTSIKDLSVEIIENFAKQIKCDVKYIVTNGTLNEAFDAEKRCKRSSCNRSNITQP